jgi:hypothetical protein
VGWSEFANRELCRGFPRRDFEQPRWDGSSFAGRTLLVHAEQGFGDTLQFARYMPLVRALGGRVLFEVQPRLVPLLRTSGFGEVVAAGETLDHFDLHVPLLDLPILFRTTLETMPADVPYLKADPQRVALWRQRLSTFAGLRVGIHWQGNKAYALDRTRSIPLDQFAPLWRLEGVQLFSLQKGEGAQQLAELHPASPIHAFSAELDPGEEAFIDTAAVMQLVDLVITSDTATAHLAGALGVPVWVALCSVPDWRWFLDRGDSPWYPTMRLFRQPTAGDWHTPMLEMARLLRERLGAKGALLSNDDVDPST